MNEYASYIALSRYARLIEEKGRRETWPETVKRYCDFWKGRFPDLFPYDEVYSAIVYLEVMPSMRALMTAGRVHGSLSPMDRSLLAPQEAG